MNKGEIVVVTGSSGCLGHQTVKLLIERDDQVREVRCFDLVEPSKVMQNELDESLRKFEQSKQIDQSSKEQNEVQDKKVKFIRGDIRDINIVERLLQGAHCIIHCAARQDLWIEPKFQDANELESINVIGTENLLKTCIRLGVPKFVHVSSFETFVSYHTIYYATESTIPDPKYLLFGPSATTKKMAENLVRQYSNVKLKNLIGSRENQELDSLRAVIIRFTPIYGEYERYFVSKLLEITKFFGGKLQRYTNIWIRQQPIYVGNAAWSLVKANRRLNVDETISGEEFHITDETAIGDPFDFVEPFVECRGMQVSKSTFPAWPVWFLIVLFSFMRTCLKSLDFFGLFTTKKSRLDQAIELDQKQHQSTVKDQEQEQEQENMKVQSTETTNDPNQSYPQRSKVKDNKQSVRWYHLITPQTFYFMCNSLFLNRTKASLRLNYEPLFSPEESLNRSLDWYKNHLEL